MTKSLKDILTVVEKNDNFIYLNVDDYTKDENRRALVMNGFDGRETFIRVMFPRSIGNVMTWAVTFWWSGREPANTETYYFNDFTTNPPLVEFCVERLVAALKELCGDNGSTVIEELKW